MDLFYISIINRQNYITEKLNALRPNLVNGDMLDFTISKLNPFSLLPDSVLSRLSDDEVRDIFEIPKVEAEVVAPIEGATPESTNSVLRDLTGRQMQGLQRIIRKFNKDELTYEQAAQLLKSSYGFADEAVDIWLVTKEEEEDAIN